MKILSHIARMVLAVSGAAALAACAQGEGDPEDVELTGQLNIYSSRHYDTDLALYEDFTRETGIEVRRIEADADALIERLKSEGEFSPADLLVTVDAGRLWRAEQAGVLAGDALVENLDLSIRGAPQDHALVENVDRVSMCPPDPLQNPVRLAEHR